MFYTFENEAPYIFFSKLISVMTTIVIFYNSPIIKEYYGNLLKLYKFVCENDHLFFNIYDFEKTEQIKPNIEEEDPNNICKMSIDLPPLKYEDKYLEKINTFPNEYYFTDLELEKEQELFNIIKAEAEKNKLDAINELNKELEELTVIQNEITENIELTKNTKFAEKRLAYHLYEYDFDEGDEALSLISESDNITFEVMYDTFKKNMYKIECEIEKTTSTAIIEEDIKTTARNATIKNKLAGFINNYVLENTPMGNVYMRYNSDKGSFEYFSNNTIPYRYLEPIGRKYVITYWCKPLFVNIEDELKNAEIKYNEDEKHKQQQKEQRDENAKNPKNVLARMRDYNKTSSIKNRTSNNILPPQIKESLTNINTKSNEKQYLKEKANRYTWEGRLSNFCPLKHIDKKVINKNMALTYEDFKKMQKEQQNKK